MSYKKPQPELLPEIIGLYLDKKNSHREISVVVGLSISTVRRMLISSGIQIRTTEEIKQISSPKMSAARLGRKYKFSENAINNIREGIRKRDASRCFLEIGMASNGYRRFTRGPNKDRGEHVVIMELHIGRHLEKYEVVHHIDGSRDNNSIDNLQIMTRSMHSLMHRNQYLSTKGIK